MPILTRAQRARNFNGGYVAPPQAATIRTETRAFVVIKFRIPSNTAYGCLYSDAPAFNNEITIEYNGNTNNTYMQWRTPSATASFNSTAIVLDDGRWHWLAFIRWASNSFQGIIDGVSIGTSTTDPGTDSTLGDLRIGRRGAGLDDIPFLGDMCRIVTARRIPTSIAELCKIANGLALPGPKAALHYELGSSNKYERDLSVNGYHGTLNGVTSIAPSVQSPIYLQREVQYLVHEVVEETAGPQTITLPLLASEEALFALEVEANIALPQLASEEQLFALEVEQNVALPQLPTEEQLFAFQLNQNVTLPQLGSEEQLFAMEAEQNVVLPFLPSEEQFFAFLVGNEQDVTLPLLASEEQLFVFEVELNIAFPFLASEEQQFTFEVEQNIALPQLPTEEQLFAPTVSSGGQIIELPLLASGEQLFAFEVEQMIALPFLPSEEQLFAIEVEQNVILSFLGSEEQLFALNVQRSIGLSFLASEEQLFALMLNLNMALPLLASGEQLFAPQVGDMIFYEAEDVRVARARRDVRVSRARRRVFVQPDD